MANRGGNRTESMGATSTAINFGGESRPLQSGAVDSPSLAMEHILASITRLEARADASDRRAATAQQPPRPEPDPPYADWHRGRDDGVRHHAVVTTATGVSSLPELGFGGGLHVRGSPHLNMAGTASWYRDQDRGGSDRIRRPTAWDNPMHRGDARLGRQPSAWDSPGSRMEHVGFADTHRGDPYRSDHSRYETMKAPRFDGADASNWISRVQYYFEHMGTPEEHRLHYVVMMFEGQASEWIFNYRENNPDAKWFDFLADVRRRFDPQCFQNFIGLIAKLCQTGSLAEYNASFETMLNRVRGVPEYILLPIYIEGLAQPVKNQVRHQYPASVAAAMALAVDYDSCLE